MELTTQSKLLLDFGRQLVSIRRVLSKSLGPTFVIKLKEFLDDCMENVLHQDPPLMSNRSSPVTTRTKLPIMPLGLGWFREVGRVSSISLINILGKHSQTFLILYIQYQCYDSFKDKYISKERPSGRVLFINGSTAIFCWEMS